MKFDIITIFPKIFDSYFGESILKRAQEKKLIKITAHNLRDFAEGKHKKVDDRPFGGGAGMVFMAEPIHRAVKKIKSSAKGGSASGGKSKRTRVILFSTRGKKFDAKAARRLAKYDQLIFICGRYEGVDERVATHIADEEISIGDFVLSGGELPAMVVVEAVARFIPGVLGKWESLEEVKGSYPVYTRPERLTLGNKKYSVPKTLMTGDHKKIEAWRKEKTGDRQR